MDADVASYLSALVGRAREILGDNLVAAYAAGSLALGDYLPGRSDIDVALVCAEGVATELKHQLVASLRHESLPCPARGLELVVHRQDVTRSGTSEAGFELELNTGARMPFLATYSWRERPVADGRFWYALDRSILHQSGQPLAGPPADEMFADLTPGRLRDLMVDALQWWLTRPTPDDDLPAPGAEDAVLGACRSLVRFRRGVWLSKVAAGRRFLADGHQLLGGTSPADEQRSLVERCIAARTGGVPPNGSEARAFQQVVLAEIRGDSKGI